MPGAPLLPTQDYCDDSQVSVFGPYDSADLVDGVLFMPDRNVVIDDAWVHVSTDGVGRMRLLRGVGPVAGDGGDASLGAVVTAERDITGWVALSEIGNNNKAHFTISVDTGQAGQRDQNLIQGTTYTDSDGYSVYDFVMLEMRGEVAYSGGTPSSSSISSSSSSVSTAQSASTDVYIYLRWRSKRQ